MGLNDDKVKEFYLFWGFWRVGKKAEPKIPAECGFPGKEQALMLLMA